MLTSVPRPASRTPALSLVPRAERRADPVPWPLPAGFLSPWDPRNLGKLQPETREQPRHWTRSSLVVVAAACVTGGLTLLLLAL